MYDHILVRYGELGLKRSNRNQFIKDVNNHIKASLKDYPKCEYKYMGMRFYIILNGEDEQSIMELLKDIPGIHSFSPVYKTDTDIEAIKTLALEVLSHEGCGERIACTYGVGYLYLWSIDVGSLVLGEDVRTHSATGEDDGLESVELADELTATLLG